MTTDPLKDLDEPAASLRVLLVASKGGQGINVTSLHDKMEELGIGRTAVDSSRKALLKAGLIEQVRMKGDRQKMFTVLLPTDKGMRIINKIEEIQEIMCVKTV